MCFITCELPLSQWWLFYHSPLKPSFFFWATPNWCWLRNKMREKSGYKAPCVCKVAPERCIWKVLWQLSQGTSTFNCFTIFIQLMVAFACLLVLYAFTVLFTAVQPPLYQLVYLVFSVVHYAWYRCQICQCCIWWHHSEIFILTMIWHCTACFCSSICHTQHLISTYCNYVSHQWNWQTGFVGDKPRGIQLYLKGETHFFSKWYFQEQKIFFFYVIEHEQSG